MALLTDASPVTLTSCRTSPSLSMACSLCPAHGTALSGSGTCTPASRLVASSVTPVTSCPSPSPLTIVRLFRVRATKKINLWNTLGQLKFSIQEDGHKEWVSCVRFSPSTAVPVIVSCGWDKLVKVWSLAHCKLRTNLIGHSGYVNTVTVSPDGSLCASGGKDGKAMLWDLNEGRHLSTLEAGDIIHAMVFSPVRYWLCAATASAIKIWDLESKEPVVEELKPPAAEHQTKSKKDSKAVPIQCISLCWSHDGSTLFAGYTDNVIRAWVLQQ